MSKDGTKQLAWLSFLTARKDWTTQGDMSPSSSRELNPRVRNICPTSKKQLNPKQRKVWTSSARKLTSK